jgi:hypothetical protein
LARDGIDCRSTDTLRKKFKQEIALGRERMLTLVSHRVLDIALSDRPSSLSACLAILRMLDPRWREPKDVETTEPAPANGSWIYPRKDLERDPTVPAIIDVEPEPESAPPPEPATPDPAPIIPESPEGWQTLTLKRS